MFADNWNRLKLFTRKTKWKKPHITAVTRNCCFSVSCSSFFPIFVCDNGQNSVAKPQLRVASNRWRQLSARSLINSLNICRHPCCLSGKNWNYFFVKPCKRDLLKMYFQSEDAKRLAKVIRKKWESQSFFYCNYLNTNFFYKFLDWDFETLRLSVR